MKQETKNCQNCKKNFVIEGEDFVFYEKVKVPPPTFCWLCRAQRRMAWRNESSLFKRKSDFSGKDIFSAFSQDSPVKVYEKDVWNSDEWDPMDYGKEYDFSVSFFEQFKDLLHTVPLKNLNVIQGVKSDYVNNFTGPKNCHLVFNGNNAENCMYGNGYSNTKDCVDTSHIVKSEMCYESFWLNECNKVLFSSECEDSYNLSFCKNCIGCNDCFGCVGLRKKKYCIFNKEYSKEEYEKKIKEFKIGSYKNMKEQKIRALNFWRSFPNKYIIGSHNTGVSGNYISHSKNVKKSFLVVDGENIKYCQYVMESPGSKDCYDYTAWGDSNSLIYECAACGLGTHNIKFCYNAQEQSRDTEYSYMCSGVENCFGCVGLKKKQYCIFNTQYDKNTYEELRENIIEQMNEIPYKDSAGRVYKYGEFFPVEISPFAYNETLAQEFFPLNEINAKENGYEWRSQKDRDYEVTKSFGDLPDRIEDVEDDVINDVIGCSHKNECNHNCTTAFKIISEELRFYRRIGVPLPRTCPNCRRYERLEQRSGINVYSRKCDCAGGVGAVSGVVESNSYENTMQHSHNDSPCENKFETSYAPDLNYIVYCGECYQKEVA